MEAVWMLNGRRDLRFPKFFNKRMAEYSDDTNILHGAYGWRWRHNFGYDQLADVITELRENSESRRVVLSMWDPIMDQMKTRKDVPCNTHAYFSIVKAQGKPQLNMLVCNRSNDLLWGMAGSNIVHFPILQEYVAAKLNIPIGVYSVVTNNLHVYTDTYPVDKLEAIADDCARYAFWYQYKGLVPINMHSDEIDLDTGRFMIFATDFIEGLKVTAPPYKNGYIAGLVMPTFLAWAAKKAGDLQLALNDCEEIKAPDWREVCTAYIQRRMK
jgi:hypothetical protein